MEGIGKGKQSERKWKKGREKETNGKKRKDKLLWLKIVLFDLAIFSNQLELFDVHVCSHSRPAR